jgi:membrane protease YdiL (CAAX protease family)
VNQTNIVWGTNARTASKIGGFIQFPLIRLIVATVFLAPVFITSFVYSNYLQPLIPENQRDIPGYLAAVIFITLIFICYRAYTKYIEKRETFELSFSGSYKEISAGFLISIGLIFVILIILYIAGFFKINGVSSDLSVLLKGLFTMGLAVFFEEIVFRLILFRLSEEFFGTWIALILQALIFGVAHIGNPNASILSTLALVFSGGLLLTTAYIYTRRIWLVFGIHMGWNYLLAYLFNIPVSGREHEGWIQTTINGPTWLTGGPFGIEASVLTVIFCLAVWFILLKKSVVSQKIIAPQWKRRKIKQTHPNDESVDVNI